jgi:iron complex transport system permease protein
VSTTAWLTGLAIALAITITVAVMIGPVPLASGMVWRVAFDRVVPGVIAVDWLPFQANIIWEIRFPRVLLGGLVGAGLALVGATMQSLLRNPLADPYLLGVSAGAGLGAVSVLILGISPFGMYSLSLAAFAGALAASTCVYALASQPGQFTTGHLILGGVAVSYVFSAVTNFLIYNAPAGEQARDVLFWMLGGLGGARWNQLALPAVVLIAAVAFLTAHARTLNVLAVGEEGAATLGVDTNRVRRQGFVLTSLVTGVLVAVSGGVGFVGLMVPHIARLYVGADHRRLLPVAALTGAIFLIWADVLARTVAAPQELPIGIITSLAGAPFFIWLMRRTGAARQPGR